MYVLRVLLMLIGTVPLIVATWGCVIINDGRFSIAGLDLFPLSLFLVTSHGVVTMELTPDLSRLEVSRSSISPYLAVFWLAVFPPHCIYEHRARSPGGGRFLTAALALFATYPVYAVCNQIRKAIRCVHLRSGTLGAFVDNCFVKAIVLSIYHPNVILHDGTLEGGSI